MQQYIIYFLLEVYELKKDIYTSVLRLVSAQLLSVQG
jgi:hypothetical protein